MHVVETHQKCLIKVLQMSTHNLIMFSSRNKKNEFLASESCLDKWIATIKFYLSLDK